MEVTGGRLDTGDPSTGYACLRMTIEGRHFQHGRAAGTGRPRSLDGRITRSLANSKDCSGRRVADGLRRACAIDGPGDVFGNSWDRSGVALIAVARPRIDDPAAQGAARIAAVPGGDGPMRQSYEEAVTGGCGPRKRRSQGEKVTGG